MAERSLADALPAAGLPYDIQPDAKLMATH